MDRRTFLIAAAGGALGFPGRGRASQPPLPRLAADATLLGFGDSLTFGTGAARDRSYPAVLARLIARRVVSSGVPGEVSARGRERLPRVLDEVGPQLVVLCHGGNDFLRNLPEGKTEANIRAMVGLARQRGAGVLLVGVPKASLIATVPGFYRSIAREFSIPYDGEVLKRVLFDTGLKSDPIHPNAQGYARIAEAVAAALRASGAVA